VSIEDELCVYVLFFNGDIKKEIHLLPQDNDFKALLYQQGKAKRHNAGLLFIFYVLVGIFFNLKTLLYCTQLDYGSIITYAHS